jgi:hypothetical protein
MENKCLTQIKTLGLFQFKIGQACMKSLKIPAFTVFCHCSFMWFCFLFYGIAYRLEANKRKLKSGEKEMLRILQEKEVALTTLEQRCRKLSVHEEQLEGKVERLQDDTALYKELLQVCCV